MTKDITRLLLTAVTAAIAVAAALVAVGVM